jgi:hypothetical protein
MASGWRPRSPCRSAGNQRSVAVRKALWVALSEGPSFDDYLSGCGQYADQMLGLSDRLRERRGHATG